MNADIRIDVVRGRLTDELSQQLLSFWSEHGALEGDAARDRLAEVVCVAFDGDDIVGVNSVYATDVPLIGNRRFWVYRRFMRPDLGLDRTENGRDAAMVNAAFGALAPDHVPGEPGPVGLLVLVDDVELMRARPEAVWADTELHYAGYTPQGLQARIRYFDDAVIG